ncbi:MAG: HD domain-containing protein, partial [bacterium]|nr:HD domain-containing protein [bacterium]
MSDLLAAYPPESVVTHAYAFAKEAHRDAVRASGDPYVTHVIAVANTVRSWGLDEPSVAAALLHDVVEDTTFTLKDIEQRFGKEVAFLVDGLTKLKRISYSPEQRDVESLRKLVISFTKDLRVLLVKLADRLHNMRTLASLPPDRQRKISLETMEVYAPLAYRLGMQKLSGELEDLSFPHTNPEGYDWLMKNMESSYEERIVYADRVRAMVATTLKKNGIQAITVDTRAKHHTSLYKKLIRRGMDLSQIYDLVAVRIIVGTIEECYAALGIVHKLWSPIHGQFDDYI